MVELMIALACSTGIVLIATAGFRSGMRSLSAAQRLTMENDLFATGVLSALDEADWWDAYDDRSDTSGKRQRLRGSMVLDGAMSAENRPLLLGLAFSPFHKSAGGYQPVWKAGTPQGYGHGWQDDERLWAMSANNELTWWTGNKGESSESDCRFGHYAIFGQSRLPDQNPVLISGGDPYDIGWWRPWWGGNKYGNVNWGVDPAPPARDQSLAGRRHLAPGWFYNQIRGLSNGLGWYGMFDYLPANAVVAYSATNVPMPMANYHKDPADCTDSGGRPLFFVKSYANLKKPGSRNEGFPDRPYFSLVTFSSNWVPHCVDYMSMLMLYSLIPPANVLEGSAKHPSQFDERELVFFNRNCTRMECHDLPSPNIDDPGDQWSDYLNNMKFAELDYETKVLVNEKSKPDILEQFVKRTMADRSLLAIRPQSWPDMSVTVARYLRLCRFSSQFKVGWYDSVQGRRADLRFTAMGTTLRGARRQRGLDQ